MTKTKRQQRVAELSRLPYAIEVEADECDAKLCYVARHPELPGCMAQGWTPQEAVAELQEARELYIVGLLEHGLDVPRPQVSRRLQRLAKLAA